MVEEALRGDWPFPNHLSALHPTGPRENRLCNHTSRGGALATKRLSAAVNTN